MESSLEKKGIRDVNAATIAPEKKKISEPTKRKFTHNPNVFLTRSLAPAEDNF